MLGQTIEIMYVVFENCGMTAIFGWEFLKGLFSFHFRKQPNTVSLKLKSAATLGRGEC
jgi:hypothetical protein